MKYYNLALLKKVQAHLKGGGVIAYPTEYCFGLGCDPFNYRAVNKILRLKLRNNNKGMIVIAAKQNQLSHLVNFTGIEEKALKQYWPGPVTLLFKPFQSKSIPKNLIGKHTKLAVRVTKHKLVRQLCSYLGHPLVSTSANKSGYKPLKTYRECKKIFGKQVLVLPGITNWAKRPSSIIDWEQKLILR